MDKSEGFLVQKLFTCCCLQSKHTQTLRKQWRKWKYVQHDESDIQWSVKEEDDIWCCGCYGFLMYGRMRMLLVVPGPGREPHTKTTAWCGLRSSCSSPKRIANWSRLWMSCSHCDAFASETHTRWLWFFGDWTTGECGRLSQPSFLAHYKIISITYLLTYLLTYLWAVLDEQSCIYQYENDVDVRSSIKPRLDRWCQTQQTSPVRFISIH